MKITLIYPGIAQIGFKSFGRGTPTTNLMSLGLGYLGASIKKNTTWNVDLIDLRKMNNWENFTENLKQKSCDVVGIYVNTVNFDFATKCAEIAHKLGKIVIMGGPHAAWAPHELEEYNFVDHLITGEGEYTIVDVLEKLEKGSEITRVISGAQVEDLDQLPFPDRELFDIDDRLNNCKGIFPFPHRYLGIIGSRGCSYNCAFCQPLERKLFGRKVRFRSVKNIINEVAFLKKKYRAEFIMFQDDLLTQQKDWIIDLCSELKKLKIDWGGLSRVDTLDAEIIRAMTDSRCKVLQFGFESGSQRILKLLRKGTTVDQALNAAKLCKDNGILIFANYMMGIPTETEKDLEATYNLMKEINPEIHAANYFSPIPGSNLYEYCKDNDLISTGTYEMFVRGAIDNKVKGIDYDLLARYKQKIDVWTPVWYSKGYYASSVLKRWIGLLKQWHLFHVLKELVHYTPFLNTPVNNLYNRVKGKLVS